VVAAGFDCRDFSSRFSSVAKKRLQSRPGSRSSSAPPITPIIMDIISKIEKEQMKSEVTDFNVGDTVKVHNRVVEGGKERIQIFQGIVLARGGSGINQAFTVRKISYGTGVERVYPLHSPRIAKIEVVSRGKVRRAKLHYLRDRVGKRAIQVKAAE
jgi:large subunit ribosomal protein L19